MQKTRIIPGSVVTALRPFGPNRILAGLWLVIAVLGAASGAAADDSVLIPLGGAVAGTKIPDWVVVASFAGTLGLTVSLIGAAILRRRGNILIRELSRSEARFQDIAEVAGDWIWEMDADFRFTYISDRMYDLSGFPHGSFTGKTRLAVAGDPEMTESWRVHLEILKYHRPFRNFEYETVVADGRIRHFRISGKPVFDDDGSFVGYRGMGADVTEVTEAVAALRNSEALFRSIVDNSSAAIVLKGLDGRFQLANRSHLDWYSAREEDVLGKTAEELFPDGHGGVFAAHDREVIESGLASERESSSLFSDGTEHMLSIIRFPVFNADGDMTGLGSIGVDITDRKRAERDATEKAALLQTILDSAPLSISFRDQQGRYVFVNKWQTTHLGIKQEDYLGKTPTELHGPVPGVTVEKLAQQVVESRNSIIERELKLPRYSDRVFRYSILPVFDGGDSGSDILGALVIGQDVTAQKQSEDAVRRSEALLQTILDAVPASISFRDAAGRFVFLNKHLAALIDVQPEDYIGKTLLEARSPVSGGTVAKLVAEVLETKQPIIDRDLKLTLRAGRLHRYSVIPVFDDNGDVSGVLAIGQDVSAQKEAEDAVRQSEALLRSVMDHSPSTISLQDLDGRIRLANRAFLSYFNTTAAQAIGELDSTLMAAEHWKAKTAHEAEVIETGEAITKERRRPLPSGGVAHRLVTKFPVRGPDDDIVAIGSIGADLSELRKVEENLHQLEARFSEILRIAPEGIMSTDTDGVILIFNDAAEKIFGYDRDEMLGQSLDVLLPESVRGVHGRYLETFIEGPETARLMGGRGEISGRRRDGSIFPAEASISKLQTGGQTILTVTLHDITERREADDRLQLALREAQEADKAKQAFLANMSHELRTPLNAIMGFSEMIELEIFGAVGNERYGEYIHDISASANHLLSLVNDMLDIAKIEAGKLDLDMEYVDLAEVATEAVRELSVLIEKKGLNFGGVTDQYRETVYADSRAVRQILVNLLTNAVKFTPADGGIGVSIAPADGDFVHISVWDTGIGIAEDELEKVLTPFTQTGDIRVAREGGTGLGLAIVKALAELHGGRVTVESTIGVGTRVHVYLPNVMRAA